MTWAQFAQWLVENYGQQVIFVPIAWILTVGIALAIGRSDINHW